MAPSDWRLAIIWPIDKKGDSEDTNYRPVSVTSIICKIPYVILKKTLLSFLCGTRPISPNIVHPRRERCAPQKIRKKLKSDTFPRFYSATITHDISTIPSSSERQWITLIKLPYEPRTGETTKWILQLALNHGSVLR